MIKIHGHPLSERTRKVMWACAEAGVEARLVIVDVMTGAQKAPAYVAMNPNGRVPTMDDEGFLLWESNAILGWIADQHAPRLGGGDKRARAQVAQWLSWEASDLDSNLVAASIFRLFQSFGVQIDETALALAAERAKAPLAALNLALAGRDHLVGSSLTVADIAVGEALATAPLAQVDLEAYPHVARYARALHARPAFLMTRPKG